jgi:hypothetical protein
VVCFLGPASSHPPPPIYNKSFSLYANNHEKSHVNQTAGSTACPLGMQLLLPLSPPAPLPSPQARATFLPPTHLHSRLLRPENQPLQLQQVLLNLQTEVPDGHQELEQNRQRPHPLLLRQRRPNLDVLQQQRLVQLKRLKIALRHDPVHVAQVFRRVLAFRQ